MIVDDAILSDNIERVLDKITFDLTVKNANPFIDETRRKLVFDAVDAEGNPCQVIVDLDGSLNSVVKTKDKESVVLHNQSLAQNVNIQRRFNSVHPQIPDNIDRWKYSQASDEHGVFDSAVGSQKVSLNVLNMDQKGNESLRVDFPDQCKKYPIRSKQIVKDVIEVKEKMMKQYLTDGLNMGWATTYVDNRMQINVMNVEDRSVSDFEIIRDRMMQFASERKLKKSKGCVYKPIQNCPCAYEVFCTYAEYINLSLRGNDAYMRNPNRFDDCKRFLENYKIAEMPELEPDDDLISFSNGVYVLSESSFVPYSDSEIEAMKNRVARKHIDAEFSGSTDTPLFDKILSAQFDVEVSEIVHALLGRLMFPVGKFDNWQVFPYLIGVGGTGKSQILKIPQEFYPDNAIGLLPTTKEDVFGLANLFDKKIVIGCDVREKMSKVLEQENLQSMTCGERMTVQRKQKEAISVIWSAPLIIGSNHEPDYVSKGGNLSRRIVSIRFDNPVTSPQEDLWDILKEKELPSILLKVVNAYHRHRIVVKETPGGFWKSVPDVMKEWQVKMSSATNKLHAFLSMDDDDRGGVKILKEEGYCTWVQDLKGIFERHYKFEKFDCDPAVLATFGFHVQSKRVNICKECKQVAKARGGTKCCEAYSIDNRAMKQVIFNMRIEKTE